VLATELEPLQMSRKRTQKERIAQRLLWISVLVAVAGAAFLVWWLYFKVLEFRVAVSNANGEDAAILTSINDWMVSENRRFRLRVIPTGSPAASLEKLAKREVEIAVARGDRLDRGGVSSIMLLFSEVAGVVMPENTVVKTWADLNKVAIGVPRGTAPDDPLLLALLRLNGVSNPRLVSLETEQVRTALERKQVQALGFVSPLPGYASRNFHLYFGPKSGDLSMLAVEEPDLLAAKDKRFASASVVAGSLRANPATPDEAVGTLAIGRHLFVLDRVNNFRIAQLVRVLIDARRALFSQHALLRQTGQPDLEADAFLKVHQAAANIYNGNEPSWRDLAIEWIYILPMVFGAVATIGIWIFQRYIHPEFTDPTDLVSDLLEIRIDAAEAESEYELHELRVKIDEIASELTSEAYEYADIEGTGAVLTAMLIAENQINERRAQLRDPGHALKCPPPAPDSPSEKVAHALAAAKSAKR
jgi:TRAP-type uncharacterized transport system substrate-binding protein